MFYPFSMLILTSRFPTLNLLFFMLLFSLKYSLSSDKGNKDVLAVLSLAI